MALLLAAPFVSRELLIPVAVLAILAMDLSILLIGLLRTQAGDPDARVFTLAWLCFLVGAAAMSLNKYGIVPRNSFTENLLPLVESSHELSPVVLFDAQNQVRRRL